MRIKIGNILEEVERVEVRENDIKIGSKFIQTGKDTKEIDEQLLKSGWADLSSYDMKHYY